MCLTEHEHEHKPRTVESGPRVSRRRVMTAAALAVPAGLIARQVDGGASPAAPVPIDGAFSMAMHLHSSFSEGYASMSGHLREATRNSVDVAWWTDHDDLFTMRDAKRVVHFTSLTANEPPGPPWFWRQRRSGSLTPDSGGGIVATPASPLDPVAQGSLHLLAQGTTTATASVGYFPDQEAAGRSWKTTLTQQLIRVEVLPTAIGQGAYLEIAIATSHHPAVAGRSTGQYSLSYRIGGPDAAGTRRSVDRLGIVSLPRTVGRWNSLRIRPDLDLAALFPELDPRDFSLFGIRFSAVSTARAKAEGFVDFLRFERPVAGEGALTVQRDLMSSYATKYPRVAQRPGLEVSRFRPHINWYGPGASLPTYAGVTEANYFDYVRQTLVPDIHAAGALASYNHPYGTSFDTPPDKAAQDALLRQIATTILPLQACGCDIMEVGYPTRGGADLAHHVGLWDVMSRNAIFLTGNGVSDDHAGTNWQRVHGGANWLTYAWAADKSMAALLPALRAGRAWCASISAYRGALDLMVDGRCAMGSASVSTLGTRSLTVTATNLPTGATVQVVQGAVDYPGTANPMPSTRVVATLTPADLASGRAVLPVDTRASSFVRTQVLTSSNAIVALSNPVWLLREPPARGIPAHRSC